jgi:isoleucyl-tRNA synthetase
VVEGSDQHRGWFQSSLLTAVAMVRASLHGTMRSITLLFILLSRAVRRSWSIGGAVASALQCLTGQGEHAAAPYKTVITHGCVAILFPSLSF